MADEERRKIAVLLKQRQELLLPHYHKVAEHYADLHDVPARMLAKRCVHAIVDWNRSRPFFFGRLRRRLQENAALDRLAAACPSNSRDENRRLLHSVVGAHVKCQPRARFYDQHELAELDSQGPGLVFTDGSSDNPEQLDKRIAATTDRDLQIAAWLESSTEPKNRQEHPLCVLIAQQTKKRVCESVAQLVAEDNEAAIEGLGAALVQLPLERRRALLDKIKQMQ